MLRIEVKDYACTGCGTCLDTCMMDVFRMKKGKAYPAYLEDCQACFLCIEDCPREAIEMAGNVKVSRTQLRGGHS